MPETIAVPPASRGRVLLVDDEPALLVAYQRVLQRGGFEVETLGNGVDVRSHIACKEFDVVISDISMPTASGLDVLREVRAFDRDLPVVLMTGRSELSTALGALENGAQRYLVKPVEPQLLCRAAEEGVALRRRACVRSAALEVYHQATREKSKHAELSHQLDRALATVYMAYQPIVSWSTLSVIAYEALIRTHEPSFTSPGQIFAAAEALGRLHEVGRLVRRSVSEALRSLPHELDMFVNLHPNDLRDPDLFSSTAPLSAFASRVVLEVTERESLSGFGDVAGHAAALRSLGFRLAVDDFGSGYGGLGSLVQLRPDIVKIDMGLVRGVDSDPTKLKMVASALTLCNELGMSVVAEGVETAGERDALLGIGYDLMQGFLFARPGRLAAAFNLGAEPGAPTPVSRPANGRISRPAIEMPSDYAELLRIQGQLDCAPITVVRLDMAGRVTHVNAAWRKFACSNGANAETIEGVGLDFCAIASSSGPDARAVAAAVGEILAGTRESYTRVDPCHSAIEARWFRLDVRRVAVDDAVVVMYTNITDQHIAEARLCIQAVAAQALVERVPLLEACSRFVRSICDRLEYDFAAVWFPDDNERLRCVDGWARPGFDVAQFEQFTRNAELEFGEGLPGTVWQTRSPEWVCDLRNDTRWARSPAATTSALRTALAIPLVAGGDVFAVIELYSRVQTEPDQALLELLMTSGTRLGAQALQERTELRAASAEAEQRRIRGTLDSIMQCIPAFIIVVDEHGIIRFMNRVMPEYTMEEVIGSDSLLYMPPEDRQPQRQRRERVMATGVSETYETVISLPDGQKRFLSTHTSPMREDDKTVGCVLLCYDVTELKRAQAEFIATQRLAVVGTLAAGVAHEINTPIQFVNDSVHFLRDAADEATGLLHALRRVRDLAAIGAPASQLHDAIAVVAEREANADVPYLVENVPKALERCLDGLDRVSTIVRSLKEYSHPASDEMASTDLNRAIQNTLIIARSEYKYVADLETSFGDIPFVVCHVNDINQVVLNLVVNAAHAIGDIVKGTDMRGRIHISTWQEGEHVLVSVADTGAGIPDAIAHRIFEPFFTTKEVGRGSGQGLAQAWAVVKTKHGGDLTFASALGKGTTFIIRLPMQGKLAPRLEQQ